MVAEGDFVFTLSDGAFGGKLYCCADLFPIAAGKIVEHGDVMAEIPATMRHHNGPF